MFAPAPDELILVRHAPSDARGHVCGRLDVPALVPDAAALAPLKTFLGGVGTRASSPALRCRQTVEAIWGAAETTSDDRLWEQSMGRHEGMPALDLPDLGPLSLADLARHRPPEGESFEDLCHRARPALEHWAERARRGGPVALVAHAGTARAAIALTTGSPAAALAFEVAPLSLTRLRCHPGGLAVIATNWTPS